MRIVLDECLPRKLKYVLVGHDVSTVPELGWAGVKNGELLRRIENEKFHFFVTIDQNLLKQQAQVVRPFGIAVVVSLTNRFQDLEPIFKRSIGLFDASNVGKVFSIR